MRRTAASAAVLCMTIGVFGCGKYGPPVRSIPQQAPSTSEAPRPDPQVPEEKITEPADFDDSLSEEEDDQ